MAAQEFHSTLRLCPLHAGQQLLPLHTSSPSAGDECWGGSRRNASRSLLLSWAAPLLQHAAVPPPAANKPLLPASHRLGQLRQSACPHDRWLFKPNFTYCENWCRWIAFSWHTCCRLWERKEINGVAGAYVLEASFFFLLNNPLLQPSNDHLQHPTGKQLLSLFPSAASWCQLLSPPRPGLGALRHSQQLYFKGQHKTNNRSYGDQKRQDCIPKRKK